MQHIGAVIRYSQGWYVQNDATHAPIGIASVEPINGPFGKRLRVHYTDTFTKVVSLTMEPDNVLQRYGYRAGGEVGLDSADFELSREGDIRGQVRWTGSQWVVDYQNAQFPVVPTGLGGGAVRLYHAPMVDAFTVPMLTMRDCYYDRFRVQAFGADFFDIKFPVAVEDTACGCLFSRRGPVIVDPFNGYENTDGNFWLRGDMLD